MGLEPWNIDPSELRHRISVETKNVAATGTRGTPKRTWPPGIPCWAKIETLAGDKLVLARQLAATATHKVTIRYQPLTAKGNRFNWQGRIFNINWQNNVEERNVKLEVLCTEEAP
jgi:SPP1 family predicted phage head-tail adaptor